VKFLLRFDQTSEYKRPTGAYPLRDFYNICRISTPFRDALSVKIWTDLLKGLRSYVGYEGVWSGFPQNFQRPLSVKLYVRPQKLQRCKNVLGVLYHRAQLGGDRISPAAGAAKNVDFFDCLFVCSSRFRTSEFVRPISLHEGVRVQKRN